MKNIFSEKELYVIFLILMISFTSCLNSGGSKSDGSGIDIDNYSGEVFGLGDPYLSQMWHVENLAQTSYFNSPSSSINSGNDINVKPVWDMGYAGQGINIVISDDGVDTLHEDLRANLVYSLSRNFTAASPYTGYGVHLETDDAHGTATSGIAAAVGDNGKGVRGIAYKASFGSANYIATGVHSNDASITNSQADVSGAHVFNQSWGYYQNMLVPISSMYLSRLYNNTLNSAGRFGFGKGAVYVKAAGNDFTVELVNDPTKYSIGNSNFDGENAHPYTIIVSAYNGLGESSSYSSPGSNLWISAPGGEYGDEYGPTILTTDRSGCSLGYANTYSGLSFDRGSYGNTKCNYTASMNGTSSAAPMLSGVVALMLEANPNLSFRDVKRILASTAIKLSPSSTDKSRPTTSATWWTNHASPSGYVWEQGWKLNSAGYSFHNWYGFGGVDAKAAVEMAIVYNDYLSDFLTLEKSSAEGLNKNIPDFSATGVSDSIVVSESRTIEAIQVMLDITHSNIAELAIELSSQGMKSIIINMNNALEGMSNHTLDQAFLTNAFYGMNTQGTWTIKVIDGRNNSVTGVLNAWKIKFFGD